LSAVTGERLTLSDVITLIAGVSMSSASYEDHTGEFCENGHAEYYQVIEFSTLGGQSHEIRRGPSCWQAACEAHQRWQAQQRS
jgi:hypothetical protein